jgi:hypothetical protein
VLAKMRSRRPGSKGTEWLLIKKKDDAMQPGFNIDKLDYSVLTDRSLSEIAGDEGSAKWESNRKAAVRKGAEWLFADEKKDRKNTAGKKPAGKTTKTRSAKTTSAIRKPRKTSGTRKKSRRAA